MVKLEGTMTQNLHCRTTAQTKIQCFETPGLYVYSDSQVLDLCEKF